ncbi:uncharacterized protein LOC112268784 isoform X2 [Brachypodium distachyon]|uniref:Uncharacterized protein n=1 Tax=Brachypodium distachyon TaxID=15368 RepID=A0A0Q3IQT3_BRADI|nr:uncharacterized protein LOC112268784 isoform X2 [Brachypodium distachyon]KQJ88632.2 hypothetical protein BRADI_4g20105v3 [Brachypodium distachyon]|eukprot:XP_024310673.1 uncharacterized protein LOC112268784 isoform X2 [Brachypodium distachyon]
MKVDLGDGIKFDVDEDMIRRMGCFKKGNKLIEVKKGVDRKGQLELHALLGTGATSGSITINQLVKVLEDATPDDLGTDEGKKKLKVAYTMLAFCSFLAPKNESSIVATEIMDLASDIDSIDEYDFVPYILETIRRGALKVQQGLKNPPRKLDVDGCLVFLQIAFLDHVYHGEILVEKQKTPRIKYYSKSKLKVGLREHAKKHVKYPFKDGFVDEAADFMMSSKTGDESGEGAGGSVIDLLNSTGVRFNEQQIAVLSKIFSNSLEAKETKFKAMQGAEQFGYLGFCQEMDKLKARKYVEMIQRLERHVLISRRELVDNCMMQVKRLKVDEVGETPSQTERVLVGVPVLDGMLMGGRVLPVTQAIDSTPVVYETLTQAVRAEGDSVAGDGIEAMLGQKPASDSAGEAAKAIMDMSKSVSKINSREPGESPFELGMCQQQPSIRAAKQIPVHTNGSV